MALISSGGGRLKLSAPKGLFGKAGAGIGRTGRHVARPPVHAAAIIKPPKPALTPGGPGAPAAAATPGAAPNDPFQFIKGLLQSTDPTAIRALIDPVYAPLRQEYQNQISQLDATGKARADQMSQVYQAFEQYLGGMPAQIQSIYGQKGMQDGAALTAGMAGPAGAVGDHLAAASNSGLMDTLGKNWAAYAAAQPHIYALMATQSIKQMLNATQDSEAQLRSKLLDLSSQEAGKIIDYLEQAQTKDQSLQEWAYQQKQAGDNAMATQRIAQMKYDQTQKQIAFQNWKVEQQLGHTAEAQRWREAYQKASLQEKYDAMSATDARAAKARDAAAARQQRSIAAANARQTKSLAARNARTKGPGGTSAKSLGAAQKSIQTDISTRTFRDVNQAITYYLNAYGGLVRAGYRNAIVRYVRQAWATKVPKKKSGFSGGGPPRVK